MFLSRVQSIRCLDVLFVALGSPVVAIPTSFTPPLNFNVTRPISGLSPDVISHLRPHLIPSLHFDFSSLDHSDSDAPEYFNVSSVPFYTDVNEDTGVPITLPVTPVPPLSDISLLDSAPFIANMSKSWEYSLPLILAEHNVTRDMDALIEEGIPTLSEAAQGAFGDEAPLKTRSFSLEPRRLRDRIKRKLKKWAKKVVEVAGDVVEGVTGDDILGPVACSVVASTLQPAYLIAFVTFEAKNPRPGDNVTDDQMFFLFPVHGNLPRKSETEIWYNAKWVVSEFWDDEGVVMGKRMYIRKKKQVIEENWREWYSQTGLLLHEFTHTEQYKRVGYRRLAFSRRYLYHWCKAGMDYAENKYEKEAEDKENDVDGLLWDNWGRYIFLMWRQHELVDALGFPTQTKYRNMTSPSNPSKTHPLQMELKFQKGTLHVKYAGREQRCYRMKLRGDTQFRKWECNPNLRDTPYIPFPGATL